MRSFLSLSRLSAFAALALLTSCGGAQKSQDIAAATQTRLAEAADKDGNADGALTMYRSAAEAAPTNITAQLRYADALARNGRIAQARRFLDQQIAAHPGNKDIARSSALIDIVGGEPAAAIPKLDQLIAADSRDQAARVDKGIALDLLGRHQEAQEIYRAVIAANPNDVAVRNNMAVSLMLEGRQREAQAVLEPVADMYEAPPRVRNNLAILYAANGYADRAREMAGNQIDQAELVNLARKLNQGATPPITAR